MAVRKVNMVWCQFKQIPRRWCIYRIFFITLFLITVFECSERRLSKPPELEWVGSWPFGPVLAAEKDTLRHLVFFASGGGVFITDVSDSQNPKILADAIRPRRIIFHGRPELAPYDDLSLQGRIHALCFDYRHKILYVGGQRGFSLWDVKDPYTYHRNDSPYGEENSLGPETASILHSALKGMLSELNRKGQEKY